MPRLSTLAELEALPKPRYARAFHDPIQDLHSNASYTDCGPWEEAQAGIAGLSFVANLLAISTPLPGARPQVPDTMRLVGIASALWSHGACFLRGHLPVPFLANGLGSIL